MGITKSALYYYFKSKEDLLYKSYLRTCHVALQAVEQAKGAGGSGRDMLAAYVRRHVSSDNPPIALVSEVDFLSPAHSAEIRRLARAHHTALLEILEKGVADGSLTAPSARLTEFAIMGALNWILVWLQPVQKSLTLEDLAEAFLDLFVNGLSRRALRIDVGRIAAARPEEAIAVDIFDKSGQAELRRDAIVRRASQFFNRNGFDNCTLGDVASALGLSKSALYHYVSSKEELLYASYVRSLQKTESVMRRIKDEGGSGLDQIQRMIVSAIALHASPDGPIASYTRLKSLTAAHQREIQARSRQLEVILTGFFTRGDADGSIRRLDLRLARLAVLGALNWLPKWHTPTGAAAPEAIAADFLNLFVNGLGPRRK